ncbi:MAG: hypothetical protein JW894_14150 [Bacteroidales bacterium]|nr:hypothetical protein [Bacteroidales bacterium]
MIYRTVLCLWLVLFLYPGGVHSQVYSDRQVHSYKITDKTSVEVSNKYGKIHVVTWDKDSVKFDVDFRISANNYQKMQKLKDNISFEFTSTKYYVVAKTQIVSSAGIFSDFVDAFIPSSQVTINYMVYIPKYINFKIENKFGDIYMDDFNGNLEIILSNGDLKANKLSGSPVIKVSSGDGTINNIQNGMVYVSYSDLRIKNAKDLKMETRSSRIAIDLVDKANIDSRRDKYNVEEVSELVASGYFTDINIENLKKELRASLKYGNLGVDDISNTFSFINVNSEYTDVDLFFKWNTSYNLDITHHDDVYINLPASLAHVKTKELSEEDNLKLTYGTIGTTAAETLHKVQINAPKKCVVNIIHR